MLTVKTVPTLMRMISKLDTKPIVQILKNADVFKTAKNKKQALEELKGEAAVDLGFEIISEITPQLDKIAEDVPVFVSLYKDISIAEAGKLDFAKVINEIINDEDVVNFFSNALRRKAERDT